MNRHIFKTRIEELRSLKGDEALDPDGLDWFEEEFDTNFFPPYLYPNGMGGVRLEWVSVYFNGVVWEYPAELSLDIDLKTKRAFWHEWVKESDMDASKELDLSDDADWVWLEDRLFYWHVEFPDEQRRGNEND